MVKVVIWHGGDSSVGINGDDAEVTFPHMEESDLNDLDKAAIKLALRRAFEDIWDTRAYAAFTSELEDIHEAVTKDN